jgi:hypothetical protein
MASILVDFTPVPGDWGQQIGWLDTHLVGAFPGLIIHRMTVFQREPGVITFGFPLISGDLPAARHSCISFAHERCRRRFIKALETAFREACPQYLRLPEAAP